jgi:hypothetical protein
MTFSEVETQDLSDAQFSHHTPIPDIDIIHIHFVLGFEGNSLHNPIFILTE